MIELIKKKYHRFLGSKNMLKIFYLYHKFFGEKYLGKLELDFSSKKNRLEIIQTLINQIPDNINTFLKKFPHARIIKLNQN